jgi:UDP-GlcNAc:undecaprenyl-phosphate/decaprenyl-phosphate GlcNAc-1-phosphate transferase
MDRPGELSTHPRSIHRTGGLASILIGGVVIAMVGLLDDTRHISPLVKSLG